MTQKQTSLAVVICGALALACFVLLLVTLAGATTLQWDRNTEPDMKEYKVYTCAPVPCTVIASQAKRVGIVPQPTVGAIPQFVFPPLTEGMVAVTASDTSGNESGLSVSIPFDAKPPAIPANPRLVP